MLGGCEEVGNRDRPILVADWPAGFFDIEDSIFTEKSCRELRWGEIEGDTKHQPLTSIFTHMWIDAAIYAHSPRHVHIQSKMHMLILRTS